MIHLQGWPTQPDSTRRPPPPNFPRAVSHQILPLSYGLYSCSKWRMQDIDHLIGTDSWFSHSLLPNKEFYHCFSHFTGISGELACVINSYLKFKWMGCGFFWNLSVRPHKYITKTQKKIWYKGSFPFSSFNSHHFLQYSFFTCIFWQGEEPCEVTPKTIWRCHSAPSVDLSMPLKWSLLEDSMQAAKTNAWMSHIII